MAGDRLRVKRIHVHPGAALCLQSHYHPSGHWIVVEGTAKVLMVLIEIQTGCYLGEDDIIRYEDIYAHD